jgi:hypothetical protein
LRFVVDITVSGKSPPSDVHIPHRNQRRQFAKLLLQNKPYRTDEIPSDIDTRTR